MMKHIISKKPVLRYQGQSQRKLLKKDLKADQEMIFDLARELVNAQFYLADDELTNRLWKEVADRQLDEKRIIHLMYKCIFHDDNESMVEADEYF